MKQEKGALSAMTRRGLLRSASARVILPLIALPLASCGAFPERLQGLGNGRAARDFALLLPLTGAAQKLGQNMARAAGLVAQAGSDVAMPQTYDTADTAQGAQDAAKQAIDNGAKILIGPLRADQTPAVLAVAGKRPVITFSNDDALAAQGAFVMGVTPAQSVAAMFSYARAQGLTRIAVLSGASPLGVATGDAARAIAGAGGITLTARLQREPGQAGLVAALRNASGGKLPQAVFVPEGGATLAGFANALSGSGVQLLGSVQWGIDDVTRDANLAGAWFAAPPPDLFQPFADRFQAAFGEQPGIVAALGHDAALLAVGLANGRGVSRKGIVREAGFTGALGPFRFLDSGRCQRDLAVLGVEKGRFVVLAEVAGT